MGVGEKGGRSEGGVRDERWWRRSTALEGLTCRGGRRKRVEEGKEIKKENWVCNQLCLPKISHLLVSSFCWRP